MVDAGEARTSHNAVEAANGGGEEYGTSRPVKPLQEPGVSAQSVLTKVQEFASGGTLSDDATAIVLRDG